MHWLVLCWKRQTVMFLKALGWLHFPNFLPWEFTAESGSSTAAAWNCNQIRAVKAAHEASSVVRLLHVCSESWLKRVSRQKDYKELYTSNLSTQHLVSSAAGSLMTTVLSTELSLSVWC